MSWIASLPKEAKARCHPGAEAQLARTLVRGTGCNYCPCRIIVNRRPQKSTMNSISREVPLVISKVCSCERLPNSPKTSATSIHKAASSWLAQKISWNQTNDKLRANRSDAASQCQTFNAEPYSRVCLWPLKNVNLAKLRFVFTKRLKSRKNLKPKKSLILILLFLLIIIIILPHPKDPLKSGHAPPRHLEWNHSEKLLCPCPSPSKSQQIGKVGKATTFIYVIFTMSSQTAC